MPKLTPQQAREKQASRLKASTSTIAQQVNAVSEAPGIKAAKQADKMLNNLTTAVTSGRWGRRVASVSLEDWKTAMIQKGIPRIAAGIDAAAPKVEAFFTEFFPLLDTIKTEVDKMPSMTLQDNINRMVHQVTRAAEFKRGKR